MPAIRLDLDMSKTAEQNVAEMPPDQLDMALESAAKAKRSKAAAQKRWREKGGKHRQLQTNKFLRAVHRAAVARKKMEDQLAQLERAHAKTRATGT